MTRLFRKEVLEEKRRSALGSVSLVQPIGLWMLAACAFISAIAVVAFLIFGEYTRRSRVIGELVPDLGLSTVVATSAGVVVALHAEEGEHVGENTPLLLINSPRVTAAGDDALSVLRAGQDDRRESLQILKDTQQEQMRLQQKALEDQRRALRRELAHIEEEIQSRTEQVRIGREVVRRYHQVADQRYVSLVQVSQQEQAVLDLLIAQQSLQRQSISLRRNLSQLEQTLKELPLQLKAAGASSDRELAVLNQEAVRMEADGEVLLRAPVAGLVAHRFVEVGQAVQPNQPILSILPLGSSLHAQLMVPSAAIGFVKPGDRVLLRYQAYPYQKFGSHEGKVLRVSRSATPLPNSAGANSEPMYRVLVSLHQQSVQAYGHPEALLPGMRLEADVMGERRRLFEWVLEPLYSVTGRTGGG